MERSNCNGKRRCLDTVLHTWPLRSARGCSRVDGTSEHHWRTITRDYKLRTHAYSYCSRYAFGRPDNDALTFTPECNLCDTTNGFLRLKILSELKDDFSIKCGGGIFNNRKTNCYIPQAHIYIHLVLFVLEGNRSYIRNNRSPVCASRRRS